MFYQEYLYPINSYDIKLLILVCFYKFYKF